ncbi:MAG: cytochrome o ubiquinol oxidase subunit III [Chlamydiae bacterium]|nr:cytochrome o ubiquinol oxidase subunit III [Chlamydiota bacterium]
MKEKALPLKEKSPDPHHNSYARTVFGFWLFLLSDFVLFGVLFACFAVLRENKFGGPGALDLFNLDIAFSQSLLLLCCSFFAGLGGVAIHRKNKIQTVIWFSILFFVGLAFVILELKDLSRLIALGADWTKSGFLSAFYTVVGTHILHVILGLMWIPVLLWGVIKLGIAHEEITRGTCLRLFWQFLNIVWIFIFAFVYFAERG